MSDQILAHLDQLSSAFVRIHDRADWIRAAFTLKAGKFGFFGFGHPCGDGVDTALISCSNSDFEKALLDELFALTDQASILTATLIRSGLYKWTATSNSSLKYDLSNSIFFWLVFILHTPPLLASCRVRTSDGAKSIALMEFQDGEVDGREFGVWIDNYPQVCISALATAKAAICTGMGSRKELKRPEMVLPVLLSAPDLARWFELEVPRVESALRRFRKSHPDSALDLSDFASLRTNEPNYLYRTAQVRTLLQDMKNKS